MHRIASLTLLSTVIALAAACVEPEGPATSIAQSALSDEACYGSDNFKNAVAPPYEDWKDKLPPDIEDQVYLLVDLDDASSALFQVDVDGGKVTYAAKFPRAKRGHVITYLADIAGQLGAPRTGPTGPIGPRGDDPYFMGPWLLETAMRFRAAPWAAEAAVNAN